jgi:hypothetical protein
LTPRPKAKEGTVTFLFSSKEENDNAKLQSGKGRNDVCARKLREMAKMKKEPK